MKGLQRMDGITGALRTVGAAAGMAILALGTAPGALAAGEQAENLEEQAMQASARAGSNVTLIWGFIFAMAALGIITAEIARQKSAARHKTQKS